MGENLAIGFVCAVAVSTALGIWLSVKAVIDLKTLRKPNALSLPLVGLLFAAVRPYNLLASRAIGAGSGFLAAAGFGEIFY